MRWLLGSAVKFILLPGVILLALGTITLLGMRIWAQHTTAARIRINSPGGIHSIEKVRLGGVEQWIQIRGHDRTKPILLFLHGGPGFPQMPFSQLNAELEKAFVVVQWDQRGAGKSYSWSIPDESMRVARFVSDSRELVQFLLRRFKQPKIYLVAHSWGTLIGALMVAQNPEVLYAYVSIGQVASLPETQQVRYQFAVDAATKENNQQAVTELRRIGRPPHSTFEQCNVMEKWVNHYSAEENRPIPPSRFFRLAFDSPVYSWLDLARIPLGFKFSFENLWREIFYDVDLFKQTPRIEVPVYFFLGRHDSVVTTDVTQHYFDALEAPRGKQLIWFDRSGHWPHFTENERYRELLVNKVLAETGPAASP